MKSHPLLFGRLIFFALVALAGACMGWAQDKPAEPGVTNVQIRTGGGPADQGTTDLKEFPSAIMSDSIWAPGPAPDFKTPKFILVRKAYSPACTQNLSFPPGPTVCVGWYFTYTAYESLEVLFRELNDYGRYWGGDDIVAVYRLDDKSEVKIKATKIQKVIPEHVEERKWEETVWSTEK